MIKVSVEIRSGTTCVEAAVLAESIVQALNLTNTHYPGCETKLLFPIDSEVFFVKNSAPSGMVLTGMPEEAAG
jgi:hypothetical protein